MPKLIKDGAPANDQWQFVDHEHLQDGINLNETEQWLIPLSLWDDVKNKLEPGQNRVGVWVTGDEPAENFADKLDNMPVIAIKFPVFTDGRGFSLARQLREKYGFQGELRAAGYFLQDQLFYLRRCGFNAFLLDDDADVASYLESLQDFSDSYQAAVDQPRPLFRRRAS
jgi:uncharacterized protein (DUF934 family)